MAGDGLKSSPAYRSALKRIIELLALILMGCCVSSCAGYHYNIKVNGYTDPNAPSLLKPGGSFFVIKDKEAKNPLLEAEIKEKIIKLLTQRGYAVTPTFDQADYYLFFSYGMGEPRSVTVVTPDYYGGLGWGGGYRWGGPAFYFTVPPWGAYPSYATRFYNRWLLINVVDGPAYRSRKESRPVWVGEARSMGPSSDLRTVLNYLLVADFKEFGKNTGQAVTVELKEKDPEVAALTRK
jgi:hypothetical protein